MALSEIAQTPIKNHQEPTKVISSVRRLKLADPEVFDPNSDDFDPDVNLTHLEGDCSV